MLAAITLSVVASVVCAAEMEPIRVSEDGRRFVTASGKPFIPWGFNYDREEDGRLIEDYWDDEWEIVESAFHEMKALRANVVRIHLQFGKFMENPTTPRKSSLERLTRLLQLAEETGLYIDLTGLGCYHKQDVPEWYDALEETDRWLAQAAFWDAVAKTCASSPAVFCYNLMNEPVVPGGDGRRDDWLGRGFAGKHFVQFIALERAGRDRPQVAIDWIRMLTNAIRRHDKERLITVGLVHWSLDRPGLTSGFVPEKIADELDFLAVHLYPERDRLDEALAILKEFAAAGKPVLIEETFTLKCGAEELGRFLDKSREHAAGWIGFYWGTTPEEYRERESSLRSALVLSWLDLFQAKTDDMLSPQPKE
jgi:hypothetical protein